MKCPLFLGSGNNFVSKSSYINIVMLAFLISIYLFYPFNFSLSLFLFLKCISCEEHLVGSCFLSNMRICLLIGGLSTAFIINVITDTVGFILPSFQFVSSVLCSFVSLFPPLSYFCHVFCFVIN